MGRLARVIVVAGSTSGAPGVFVFLSFRDREDIKENNVGEVMGK